MFRANKCRLLIVALHFSVAAGAKLNGGSILMRVRLLDEVDRPGSSYGMVDDDLVQYYQFLADKGDIPAQVSIKFWLELSGL